MIRLTNYPHIFKYHFVFIGGPLGPRVPEFMNIITIKWFFNGDVHELKYLFHGISNYGEIW